MYRFLLTPKWIGFHLLVAGAIVAMVNLGFWQFRRLDERQAFNAVVESRYDEPATPVDELIATDATTATPDLDTLEWRPVTAVGEYAAAATVRVVNRSQYGRAGDNVVTPLVLDDGRVLLVNRGFAPLDDDVPDPPAGIVEVTGRLRVTQERRRGQLSDPASGALSEVHRVDIDRLADQLPGEVIPMYVDLVSSTPAEAGDLPEAIAPPELDEGPHLSYAVQWFLFSTAVAIGWVLAVRHSVRARRPRVATGTSDPTPVG